MRRFPWALLAIATVGCARGPNVESDLPLRRVVIYRNGVGYFERAGRVDGEKVTFKMRGRMVGDFLATLAIVERGGSSVRSASFPIDVEDEKKTPKEPPPELASVLKPWPPPNEEEDDPNRLRDVVLHLDGEDHDLSIGYVSETPVWRPSYRLVVSKGDRADLQTWGIVQNLSGEDWTDVELVLVAGAPIAFQSTLGTPVVPDRPVVTDSGEVIMSVPGAVTSLSDQPESDKPTEEAPPEAEESGYGYEFDAEQRAEEAEDEGVKEKKASRRMGAPSPKPAPAGAAPPPPPKAPEATISAPKNLSALAAIALEGGATKYQLPNRVTVPNESATMVLLINQTVPGEVVFLFAPDGGVPDSAAHPFRVARFQNVTSGLLERGPIAVFEKGSFLGEGVVEPLPPKAKATVPFALERGLAVESEVRYDQLGARLQKIEASEIFVSRDSVQKTIYRVKNGTGEGARVLVKHPRRGDARLHDPPPGTEDNVGTGYALVPVSVPARKKAELIVDERSDFSQQVDWLSDLAELAVEQYLGDPKADPKAAAQLRAAWEIREKLVKVSRERESLEREQQELEKAARETRLSLQAIEKNTQAADLRQKLTARLREISTRMDAITKRMVELKMSEDELRVRFQDAIRDISVVVAPGAPAVVR